MIRLGLLFLLLLFENALFASHMVGGGFRYQHIVDNKYVIQLDYYKDCSANAVDYPPGAIRIGIYRKGNNTLVQSLDLSPGPISTVSFIVDTCVKTNVTCVQKRIYEDTLYLNTLNFNDSTGYYLSYEQCCRNFGIKNVQDPDKSGIAYYAEFLPFTKSNQNFRNSSPYLLEDQNVYLCVGELYAANYAHIDPDGDSLSYKLIDPLMGNTDPVFNNSNGISVLNPKPYPAIIWNSGYGFGINNFMDGQPDLKMDSLTGRLSIKPTQAGMYSFAYKVEEYRMGKLLAVYNREVQYYSVFCAQRAKPDISLLNPNDTIINADSTKCLQFYVKDLNIQDSILLKSIRYTPELLNQNIELTLTSITNNELLIKACVKVNCNLSENFNENLTIIVSDDSCPFVLLDTIQVNIQLLKNNNASPTVRWLNPSDSILTPNVRTCLNFISEDIDAMDSIKFQLSALSSILKNIVYEVQIDSTIPNKVLLNICFTPDCSLPISNSQMFKLYANDRSCFESMDSLAIFLKTENEEINDPFSNIPNVFSPNNDGKNDYFSIHNNQKSLCINDFSINIYNRWGVSVYQSKNFFFEWSGEGLASGVYFYVIQLGKQQKIGHISIIY